MKKNKGFTLIELSVIVFIIGLMGLYVLPNIGDRLFHTQTKFSLRRIAGNIKEVFNRAAIKRQTYYFFIDFDKNRYWVALPDINGEFSKEASTHMIDTYLPNKIVLVDVAIPSKKFNTGENVILFTPRGLSEKHMIHLKSDDINYTLIISPLTGQVEIKEGYVEFPNT